MKKIFNLTLIGVTLLTIVGCAPNISPNTYTGAEVGHASKTVRATVISIRPVTINNESGVGGLVGTAAGATAGSAIGGDTTTNILAGIGGAIVGGAIGHGIDKNMHTSQGMEYVCRLHDSSLVTLTQPSELGLQVGQKVLIIYGKQARLVPDNS